MTTPAIELSDIACTFVSNDSGKLTQYTAVKGVNLTIGEGEFVSVVGPTGCGKSTLLNMSAGLLQPSCGTVKIFGKPLEGLNKRAGYMFQADSLMPWMSALDNVAAGLIFRGEPREKAHDQAREWLKRVGLAGFEESYPHHLSGGMRKRVAMAQTLIMDPDIILMDDNEEKLSTLNSNFDLMTATASPTSIKGLKEVGVGEADLFIAVTPDESRNMTACMLANNLGAQKTVARIDNYEYLLPKNKEFFQKLGVDSLIYPEMLAAKEIVSSIRMSWVRQWWEFCGGALILIGTKMREKAEILNIPLHELGGPELPYHVVAIKRGSETLIPRGDDTIKLHDIVYFTTTRKYVPYIRKIAGKEDYADVRNVMIMGGSRIAVRTAQYVPDYMQVKIVDNDLNRCNRLTELLDDRTMIINGDGRDMDLLVEEGLKNTEAFVALTGNSETNILACLAAKRMGVSKTVAEVENIDYIGMAESLDIGTVINKKMIAASHIYQMMLDADVSNVKCLTFANADVAEFTVKAGSKITKHPVKDLGLPKGATIGGLIRQGEGVVVMGNTLIQPGDHVVVFCLNMMIKKIEKYFN